MLGEPATTRRRQKTMAYLVGLTGGIGSGKSAAARIFQELGAEVIDTDALSHELTSCGGAAIAAIREQFGPEVIDANGALDRAAMRVRAFGDESVRRRLEAILHPMIRAEADQRIARSTAPYVVLVVPLLVETGFGRARLSRVAVVDCGEETQVARTTARSALADGQVRAIMAAQASRAERLAIADDVINNHGELAALRAEVERLHCSYIEAGRGAGPA
jgi:dephospho-CoA kinase